MDGSVIQEKIGQKKMKVEVTITNNQPFERANKINVMVENERKRRMEEQERIRQGLPTIINEKIPSETVDMLSGRKLLDSIQKAAPTNSASAHFVVAVYRMENCLVKDIACFDFPEGCHKKIRSFFTLDPPSSPKKLPKKLSDELGSSKSRRRERRSKSVFVQSNTAKLRKSVKQSSQINDNSISVNIKHCIVDNCQIQRMIGHPYCGIHYVLSQEKEEQNAEAKLDETKAFNQLKTALSLLESGNFRDEASGLEMCQKISDKTSPGSFFDDHIETIARYINSSLSQTNPRPAFLKMCALNCLQSLFKNHSEKMQTYLSLLVPTLIFTMSNVQSLLDNKKKSFEGPPSFKRSSRRDSKSAKPSMRRSSTMARNTRPRPPKKSSKKSCRSRRSASVIVKSSADEINRRINGEGLSKDTASKRANIGDKTVDPKDFNATVSAVYSTMLRYMAVAKVQQRVVQFILRPNMRSDALYKASECLLGCIETLERSALNQYCIDKICQAIDVILLQDTVAFGSLGDKCLKKLAENAKSEQNVMGEPLLVDLWKAITKNLKGTNVDRAELVVKRTINFQGTLSVENLRKLKSNNKQKAKVEEEKVVAPTLKSCLTQWGGIDYEPLDTSAMNAILGESGSKKKNSKKTRPRKAKYSGNRRSSTKKKTSSVNDVQSDLWASINAASARESI